MPPKNQKKCIKIKNKEEQEKEFNEISFIKRTLKNNTHEVIQDAKIKRITTWRKSNKKFLKNFIYNILSLGILHLISLYYPSLYIKLYCNPWQAKECDYFLVENIYGQCTLCLKFIKKIIIIKPIQIIKIIIYLNRKILILIQNIILSKI